MEKTKLHWASDYNAAGNAYGYTRHMKMMRKYTEPYVEYTEDADVSITILPADRFKPVPNKYNVLFTMFEAQQLPPSFVEGAEKADELVVPCSFVRDLFKRYLPHKRISVCREGIEPEAYPYRERNFVPGYGKFRILWVGAPNPRKGYGTMLELVKVLERHADIEIYFKTTTGTLDYEKAKEMLKKGELDEDAKKVLEDRDRLVKIATGKVEPLAGMYKVMGMHNNVIFDCRNMTNQELLELYYSAHVFVFPTVGEGWGLTLCEAMATGAPCISPVHTGVAEFFDRSVGYEIGCRLSDPLQLPGYKDFQAQFMIPNSNDALVQTLHVFSNYQQAKHKAKKASRRIHEKFTWALAGRRLADIVKEADKRAKTQTVGA